MSSEPRIHLRSEELQFRRAREVSEQSRKGSLKAWIQCPPTPSWNKVRIDLVPDDDHPVLYSPERHDPKKAGVPNPFQHGDLFNPFRQEKKILLCV